MSHLPKTNLWQTCSACKRHVHQGQWGKFNVCPYCGHYQRLNAKQRLTLLTDTKSFTALPPVNIKQQRHFPGYTVKLQAAQEKTGEVEAFLAGTAMIKQQKVVIGVMDSQFMMGTLNTVVGAGIRQAIRTALNQRLPLILVIASGGARMQEGILSLLQMNTILAELTKLNEAGILTISVLTDPTMGGVTASFALESDFVFAEQGATIGFAGKRVIQQTNSAALPTDFQTAERLYRQGFLDAVIKRENLRTYLGCLLMIQAGDLNE
ncbi:acetyl-CoA carboxylase carboxyltransferase subunit beta [Loigolactobacillus backii]|uniref:Acetyl-coenzyme A carboxylase carboxyl transferase subunit beta n=1 Tax=Loigolactobacillus backii TaxID=375175 RepID=A0A192H3B0_9LACO|nr:acetyl-CoA carboxylase carboxyltransferase subunit beta [Loigolactobacillus backii]ANK59068.1 acetyl-CoA carboxyl transferase [Loigolactobacillus backii]ANK62446.1 acetyl-CoA carboxyl transferase [Loigolactobacillus backii]ANK64057.1 acetyl-CoA carboxyl transferase [Loigolactobacillus backii]ANK67549.1 acetyl-CoA carboxyl transferase [Loigolactobacillus backii]ANK70542.1 acetyl-CoA carboxyl transferase [Loigolactobacillus backii]